MKRLALTVIVAVVATLSSPFAASAFAAEKPAQAATVKFCENLNGAASVHNLKTHICLHEKRGEICEHTEMM